MTSDDLDRAHRDFVEQLSYFFEAREKVQKKNRKTARTWVIVCWLLMLVPPTVFGVVYLGQISS